MKLRGKAREEWITLCAIRLAQKALLAPGDAYRAAVFCLDEADLGDTPEYAADEEIAAAMEAAS